LLGGRNIVGITILPALDVFRLGEKSSIAPYFPGEDGSSRPFFYLVTAIFCHYNKQAIDFNNLKLVFNLC